MILSEKYENIKKLARDFAEKELPAELLQQIDQTGVFPTELIKKMQGSGLCSIKAPKKHGGRGEDTLSYVLAIEEIAQFSMTAAVGVSGINSLGSGPIMIAGTDEQLEKYLAPVARGEKIPCFALTEPGAGSDAGSVTTSAVRDGDEYVLNGRKCFITSAPIADFAIVFAKTDLTQKGSRGISTFIVDMDLPGVSCGKHENKMGIIGWPTSDLLLENVRVPVSARLGEECKGFSNAMKTLDIGRLGVAAMALGVGQACLDDAVEYAKERRQFGKRIADFQGISFMIADMATELEAARQLLYSAAQKKDADVPNVNRLCSMAKYFCTETANRVAYRAMQVHGGCGYMKERRIERMYRDIRISSIFEGTSQIQQLVIAGSLLN